MINDRPLVSVIVPVYNAEKYLGKCLGSIMNQTYPNLEIILVNDGSTDNSGKIVDEYAEKDGRIKVIHQENRGAGAARNTGLENFKGAWLCFVDSDDWIELNYVETLLAAVTENNCLAAVCKINFSYSFSEKIINPPANISLLDWRDYLMFAFENEKSKKSYFPWSVYNLIYHKKIVKNNRFTTHKVGEDILITQKFLYECGQNDSLIAVSNLFLYNYFQSENSAMRNKDNYKWFSLIDACECTLDFYQQKKEFELYDLCWSNFYFPWCIRYACECSRDIPQHKKEIEALIEKIKNEKEKAFATSHHILNISLSAKYNWNKMIHSKRKFILYGYGKNGKELLDWLLYFHIPVIEIWDNSAADGQKINDIPIKKMHSGFADSDVCVLNSMGYRDIAYKVNYDLRTMGYENITMFPAVNEAVKYAKFSKFLPFLLEDMG